MNVYTDNHVTPEPWRADAACLTVSPELFFGEDGLHVEDARSICHTCPVIAECYVAAQELKPQFGIWAGMTVRQLAEARKRERGAA